MKLQKQIALILVCLMVMAFFPACNGNGAQSSEGGSSESSSSASNSPSAEESEGASAEDSEEKITLTVIHETTEELASYFTDSRAHLAAIAVFEEEHPNVILEQEVNPSDWRTKVLTLSAANDMHDLSYVSGSMIESLVKAGSIQPVTGEFDNLIAKYAVKGLEDSFAYDGEMYAMPLKYQIHSNLVYNTVLWEGAGYSDGDFPETWDAFIACNDYFKNEGIDLLGLGNKEPWYFLECLFSSISNDHTGQEWTASISARDGQAKFTDEVFVQALERAASLTPTLNVDFNSTVDTEIIPRFLKGEIATVIGGNWIIGQIMGSYEEYSDVIDTLSIRKLPGETGPMDLASGGCTIGYCISSKTEKGSPKYQAAIDYINTVCGEVYNQYNSDNGEISPMLLPSDLSKMHPIYTEYMEHISNTTPCANFDIVFDASVANTLQNVLQDVLSGATTPEDAAAIVQQSQDDLS